MFEDKALRTLANAELFKGLTHDEVKKFYDCSQRVTFEKSATLIEKDQAGSALYLILNGQFEVDLPLGVYVPQLVGGAVEHRMTKIQLHALRAGDCFGEYSLLAPQPHSASVVATEAGELLMIPQPAFEAILHAHDRIAKTVYANMLHTLIARLRKLNIEWSLYLQNTVV